MDKRFLFSIVLLLGLTSFGFGADEFSEAANVVSSASTSGKAIVKESMQWLFALVLPSALMVTSAFLAYRFEKQKSEQDKETSKIYTKMAIATLGGFFVYIAIAMLVSRWFFGDFTSIFSKVIYAFFTSVFQ
ncbi:hypothetical protein LMG7974_01618 [Campylobacter majalis]|uniref:Uncharacterized protein n=1 Tax=Campylobacter majalis TaxID=2790656 RepID=A0ABN7KBT5_9BACT|nr:hypothetical protein [Campylobacter majalis]CAD7289541.1 hypothetical protein LMG7974_01618 [Campylobacter majalis]